jgi:hypothetical protein
MLVNIKSNMLCLKIPLASDVNLFLNSLKKTLVDRLQLGVINLLLFSLASVTATVVLTVVVHFVLSLPSSSFTLDMSGNFPCSHE